MFALCIEAEHGMSGKNTHKEGRRDDGGIGAETPLVLFFSSSIFWHFFASFFSVRGTDLAHCVFFFPVVCVAESVGFFFLG